MLAPLATNASGGRTSSASLAGANNAAAAPRSTTGSPNNLAAAASALPVGRVSSTSGPPAFGVNLTPKFRRASRSVKPRRSDHPERYFDAGFWRPRANYPLRQGGVFPTPRSRLDLRTRSWRLRRPGTPQPVFGSLIALPLGSPAAANGSGNDDTGTRGPDLSPARAAAEVAPDVLVRNGRAAAPANVPARSCLRRRRGTRSAAAVDILRDPTRRAMFWSRCTHWTRPCSPTSARIFPELVSSL